MSDELIDIDLNAVTIAKDPTTFTDTEVVTKQFVNTQLTNIIDTAPGTLDTLNELATAINNDGDVHTTITNLVTQEENTRVAADVNFNTEIDTLIANNTNTGNTDSQARIDEDTAIGVRIDTAVADALSSYNSRNTRINNEDVAREAEDTAIGIRTDNEESNRATADTALDVAKLNKSTKYLKRSDTDFALTDQAYLYIGPNWRIAANNVNADRTLIIQHSPDTINWRLGASLFKDGQEATDDYVSTSLTFDGTYDPVTHATDSAFAQSYVSEMATTAGVTEQDVEVVSIRGRLLEPARIKTSRPDIRVDR